jgi:hypothetical protein
VKRISARPNETGLAVGERRLASLEIELPRCHLLGENAISLREVRELGAQRAESSRRRLELLAQAMFAIRSDLKTRVCLRFLDLASRAELARLFLCALGLA